MNRNEIKDGQTARKIGEIMGMAPSDYISHTNVTQIQEEG